MTHLALHKMKKDKLVTLAYLLGCGEKSICSENRGPFSKAVIIEAIKSKLERQHNGTH